MNLRIALATTLLLAAPIARAQQPTPAPDAPKPDHQVREVRMDRGGPEGGPHGHSMRPEGRGEFWKNPEAVTRLGLSPDQVKKLDDISLKGKLEEIHLRAVLEEDELMMKPLMEGAFDEKKAEAQIDKIAEAHASLEKARAKSMLSLRAVLTPDQWTKLHSHEGMDRHHGMGEGPGGPGSMKMHGGPRPSSGPGGPDGAPVGRQGEE